MVNTLVEEFKREEAEFQRDVAYLMEDAEDMEIEEAMSYWDDDEIKYEGTGCDTIDPDVAEFMERMDEIEYDEEAEVQRIMETTDGISFDQMIGLEPIEE